MVMAPAVYKQIPRGKCLLLSNISKQRKLPERIPVLFGFSPGSRYVNS